MNKKGFTLVEVLAVITILAIIMLAASANYFGLIGSQEEFETEELYKYLNDAAYVYSVNHNDEYVNVKTLIDEGYVDESYGILKDSNLATICDTDEKCIVEINETNGEKTTCVETFNGEKAKGEGSC